MWKEKNHLKSLLEKGDVMSQNKGELIIREDICREQKEKKDKADKRDDEDNEDGEGETTIEEDDSSIADCLQTRPIAGPTETIMPNQRFV